MKHPVQPLYKDDNGTLRFKENTIVRALLDHGTKTGFGLNEIACREFTNEDRVQLAQLIGYSWSGFGELNYVSDEDWNVAHAMANLEADEKDIRIEYLQSELEEMKESLRPLVSNLYGIHEDYLK